jgi:hypothetical protein
VKGQIPAFLENKRLFKFPASPGYFFRGGFFKKNMIETITISYEKETRRMMMQKGTGEFNIIQGTDARELWKTLNNKLAAKGWQQLPIK